jgi:peptide-methionine (R)-S-oxide reductase
MLLLSRLATVVLCTSMAMFTVACGEPAAGTHQAAKRGKTVMETDDKEPAQPEKPVKKTNEEWKKELTPEQYRILRESGTERPFGEIYKEFKQQGEGTYYCAGCNAELFSSNEKFDSHCGWPSFYDPSNAKNVKSIADPDGLRVEVRCAVCDGHLGHVFSGEGFNTPTDQRYCINGIALKYVSADDKAAASKNDAKEQE